METEVLREKALHLLDLKARIRRLRAYKPGKILTRKDVTGTWRLLGKAVVLPVLGVFLLLKWVIPFVRGIQTEDWKLFLLTKGGVFLLYFGVLFLGALAVGAVIGALANIKGLGQELKLFFTLKKRNAQVNRKNEENTVSLKAAQQEHTALLKELLEAVKDIPVETDEEGNVLCNFFFEDSFDPEETAEKLMWENKSGETVKRGRDSWLCSCQGKVQFIKDKAGGIRMDGIGGGVPCTPEMMQLLIKLPMLYMDEKLLEEALPNKPLLYIIREISYKRLTNRYTTTTTTTYDVEGALKKYNDAWDAYEAAVPGNNFGADVQERQRGEAALRSHPESTSYSSRKDYLVGEELVLLDKAYIVRYKGKLVSVFLPEGQVQRLSMAYKLDREILLSEGPDYYKDTGDILKEDRFHGKVLNLQTDKCTADNYSTIAYLTEFLSSEMLPLDVLEPQPEGVSSTEWRLWVTMRHRYRKKNYSR